VTGDVNRTEVAQVTFEHFQLGEELGIRWLLIDTTRAHNSQRLVDNVRSTLDDVPDLEPPGVASWAVLLVDPADHTPAFHIAFAGSDGVDTTLFWDRGEAINHLKKAARRPNTKRAQRE
jgi:hypothetical protein